MKLESLILTCPEKDWDWDALSFHKASFPFIVSHPDLPWNFAKVSMRNDLDVSVEKIVHKIQAYYMNTNLSFYSTGWYELTDIVSLEYIETHPEIKWSTERYIARLPIEKARDQIGSYGKCEMQALSQNPNITPEFIDAYIHKLWDFERIGTCNPNLTPEFVLKHKEENWDWTTLHTNPVVTTRLVEQTLDKPWRWNGAFRMVRENDNEPFEYGGKIVSFYYEEGLVDTLDLTQAFVMRHFNRWNLRVNKEGRIKYYPDNTDFGYNGEYYIDDIHSTLGKLYECIPLSFIQKFPEKEWEWYYILSYKEDLTFVKQFPHKDWNWSHLVKRFTYDFMKNPENIDNEQWWKRLTPVVPLDFIARHSAFPWKWEKVSNKRLSYCKECNKYHDHFCERLREYHHSEYLLNHARAGWVKSAFLYENLSLKVMELVE